MGHNQGTRASTRPEKTRTPAHFAQLADAVRHGSATQRVAARYELADIHTAQQDFVDRAHTGKLVIRTEPPP